MIKKSWTVYSLDKYVVPHNLQTPLRLPEFCLVSKWKYPHCKPHHQMGVTNAFRSYGVWDLHFCGRPGNFKNTGRVRQKYGLLWIYLFYEVHFSKSANTQLLDHPIVVAEFGHGIRFNFHGADLFYGYYFSCHISYQCLPSTPKILLNSFLSSFYFFFTNWFPTLNFFLYLKYKK